MFDQPIRKWRRNAMVAAHPDQAGGLVFVGHSICGFPAVALAIATIAAGKSAHLNLVG